MSKDIEIELINYFEVDLILTRFSTFKDLEDKINKDLEKYNLKVRSYDLKFDYDNDFEDYLVMFSIGDKKEDIIDLNLWYGITRIGERVILESSFEEVL